MTDISNPIFHDEDAAREYLEAQRWPDGPFCPFCGQVDTVKALPAKGSMGKGWYHCRECRKKFTVRVGTLYERSHVKLHKWLMATHLLCSSKKGMSAHQLHRMLGVTYKTAWFMAHRIREAMRPAKDEGPKGGPDKVVEADETLIGGKEKNKHVSKRNPKNIGSMGKETAFALVERGGRVRSYHVKSVNAKSLGPILFEQIDRASTLMSDDAGQYRLIGPEYARYESVNHSINEYVRGDAHTNTVEGYFSLLKRGINGTYHHVSSTHLKRYLAEFDFRYNERTALGVEDMERTVKALKGIEGKRLTYRRIDCR
ncbi:IS1595 family transposase [Pelagibius sp.]|uniref:IS1595 family transposase n=1 Tax=Pelagibius sp. TaxID=1931238 RepID=UPI003BB10F7D